AEGVSVVVQANKRDAPGAMGLADLRTRLGEARWSVGVVESVASDGTGIREAFVYAVRLALDRVRAQAAAGALREGAPELVSPAQLPAQPRGGGGGRARVQGARGASGADSVAATLLREVVAAERAPKAVRAPAGASRTPMPPDVG